jgi:hypothetical protein
MLLTLACSHPDLVCGQGTHEQSGACVPDEGGNHVLLDSYPPVVVSTTPAAGDEAVSRDLDEMSVTFSRKMNTDDWAWVRANYEVPEIADSAFTDDRTCVASGVVVEGGQSYVQWINDPFHTFDGFRNVRGTMALPYPISFAVESDVAAVADLPAAVVATTPVAGTDGVSDAITRVEVTFSKDMDPTILPWLPDALETTPQIGDAGFSSPRTAYLDVTVETDTTYALWVGREGDDQFVDATGAPAVPYLLYFRTGEGL